jgi:hypothetical protein
METWLGCVQVAGAVALAAVWSCFWLWRTSRRGLGFLVSTQVGVALGAFLGARVAAFGAGGAAGGFVGLASRRG